MHRPPTVLAAVALLLALALAPAAPAAPRESNKWRLQCSGNAESEGTVVLLLTPRGGEPIEVAIPIPRRTGENAIARRIRDALKADPRVAQRYRVEVDDGEDVLVKKRRGEPNVALSIQRNTVEGLRLDPDRE